MSRIVLVNVYGFGQNTVAESHGIQCIGAYLRSKNHDVKIISPCKSDLSIHDICGEILSFDPLFVGLSFLMDTCVKIALPLIRCLRSVHPELFISIGGQPPTCAVIDGDPFYHEIIKEVNCVILGEGEYVAESLLSCLEKGENYHKLTGIAYYDSISGQIKINPPYGYIEDLSAMPFESRDTYEELNRTFGYKIPVGIIGSRGCYHNKCTFCALATYHKHLKASVRRKSSSYLLAEIEDLHAKYNADIFVFDDDCFCSSAEYISEFCSKILALPYKISFDIQCRVIDVDFDKFALLKKAGLRSIFLGAESFNNDALKFYGKGYHADAVIKCLDTLGSLGYSCDVSCYHRIYLGYILWQPNTTLEHLETCLYYVRKYRITPKTFIKKLMIYPNSYLGRWAKHHGLQKNPDDNTYIWYYYDPSIRDLEVEICNFINHVMDLRDSIRAYEKSGGISANADIRIRCDSLCIEFVENCVSSARKLSAPFDPAPFYRKAAALADEINQSFTLNNIIFRK